MKTKYYLFVLLFMALNMPLTAYSQCADIFKQGVALMEAKKYKSAIGFFQKAKKCDKNLAIQCDEKIRECRKYINPTVNPPSTKSYVITLEKETLEFGSEETAARSVKVTSDVEWSCSTDADWCTITKMDDKRLAIECKINKTSAERTANVRVNNGKETKIIKVVQKGMDAVLRFAPNQMLTFGKDGDDYVELLLESTMEYRIEHKPEWVTIHREYLDMIIIKIEPLSGGKFREGIFSIISQDGTKKDFVVIKQYKKLPQSVSNDAKTEKKTQKSSGRKTLVNSKNKD